MKFPFDSANGTAKVCALSLVARNSFVIGYHGDGIVIGLAVFKAINFGSDSIEDGTFNNNWNIFARFSVDQDLRFSLRMF